MKQMKDEALEMIAQRLKMLADPTRLKILHTLQKGEKSVQELVEITGSGQANISKHLSLLSQHNIVGRKRKGLYAFYYIADESVFRICDLICRNMEKNIKRYNEIFG